MIWKLISGCLILGIASCWLCNQKKKDQKMTNMNEGKGVQLEIVDNVSNELWKLHPTLHFMRGELMSMAKSTGDYAPGLGTTLNDSAMQADAQLFWDDFETEYMMYSPSEALLKQLDSVLRSKVLNAGSGLITLPTFRMLMIGGNWCSDTRMGLPRLCKVLDQLMLTSEGNVVISKTELEVSSVRLVLDYLRVDRDKNFIESEKAHKYVLHGGLSNVMEGSTGGINLKQEKAGRVPEVVLSQKFVSKNSAEVLVDQVDDSWVFMGSIVETPMKSWEADILKLFIETVDASFYQDIQFKK
jgi:hypothetical protein